jgi:hypothetical protein
LAKRGSFQVVRLRERSRSANNRNDTRLLNRGLSTGFSSALFVAFHRKELARARVIETNSERNETGSQGTAYVASSPQ